MRVQLPDYGTFLHWPEPGIGWIHPDDTALVNQIVPSRRVFRRERFDGAFYHLRYGSTHVRIRPVMWLPLDNEGLDVGDQVEVSGVGLSREPYIGEIIEMEYFRRDREIRYQVRRVDMKQDRSYVAAHLKSLAGKLELTESDFVENRLPSE